jgi:6-phosphogluconolactonase
MDFARRATVFGRAGGVRLTDSIFNFHVSMPPPRGPPRNNALSEPARFWFTDGMKSTLLILIACLFALPAPRTSAETGAPKQLIVYTGTYTGTKSKGIYAWRFDVATGKMTPIGLAGETPSPSYLAIDPSRRFLYAANETGGPHGGSVSAFSIDATTGMLTFLNRQTSGGNGPCHVAVDGAGKNVLVANYDGGSIEALPVESDGKLGAPTAFVKHHGSGPNPKRQEGPHAHCVAFDGADKFAFACDLGLDKVMIYKFDAAKGTLTPNEPPSASVAPGAGPRHIAVHPGGKYAYVINEMASSITAFGYDAAPGELRELQTVPTLPADFKGQNSGAEIAVHPSGKFVYGSNRGHNSIVVFAIDGVTGKLTEVEHQSTQGKTPRGFEIDPTGAWLLAANQESDNIAVFHIDENTGRLTLTGDPVPAAIPVCVKFVPAK